jgi:LDH2 family malate/lactate/ureidoglycolate dehydrogenase
MKEESIRIPYAELCGQIAGILVQAGVPAEIAALEAKIMAEADLLGVPSHGVKMLPGLLNALSDGRARPAPQIDFIRELGATCLLNCDNGPGRYVACRAMDEAVGRAQRFGVGVCLAMHTTHWGRAHAYASRAAMQGMVGICTTNAMPCMAIYGAKGKVIGNNPLAIGIPRSRADAPMVLDMAMSQAAVGKVGTWLREGREIPEGWGLNSEGRPTTDPKEILAGAVLPFGGHKGAGLALMMELLTAALAGGAFGCEIEAGDRSGLDPDSCKLFIALNPEVFGGGDVLTRRVDDYLAYLKLELATAGDSAPFTWPGERGWKERDVNLEQGVPLHPEIVKQLAEIGFFPEK